MEEIWVGWRADSVVVVDGGGLRRIDKRCRRDKEECRCGRRGYKVTREGRRGEVEEEEVERWRRIKGEIAEGESLTRECKILSALRAPPRFLMSFRSAFPSLDSFSTSPTSTSTILFAVSSTSVSSYFPLLKSS